MSLLRTAQKKSVVTVDGVVEVHLLRCDINGIGELAESERSRVSGLF